MLFKSAADRYASEGSLNERIFSIAANGYFIGAILLYVALTVLWVWILTFTPLSRAYPFVALAFAVTPLLGGLVFGEPIATRLMLGIALILVVRRRNRQEGIPPTPNPPSALGVFGRETISPMSINQARASVSLYYLEGRKSLAACRTYA